MPPAQTTKPTRKRNRKRKKRAASSSSSPELSDDSSSESEEQKPSPTKMAKVASPPSQSSSSTSSSDVASSESDSDFDSDSDSGLKSSSLIDIDSVKPTQSSPKTTSRAPPPPRGGRKSREHIRASPSPSPPPTTLPSFLPSKDDDPKRDQDMQEKFRKFWMASIAEGFRDDLEQIQKEPKMNTTKLAMLIDSLASGADVFSSSDKGCIDEVGMILE